VAHARPTPPNFGVLLLLPLLPMAPAPAQRLLVSMQLPLY
jgi:hypothetical protein